MLRFGPAGSFLTAMVLTLASSPATAGSVSVLDGVGNSYSVPVTSLKEAKFRTTLKQQYDFSCGSAALAALLKFHYKYPVTEQQVFQNMYDHGDQDKIHRVGFSLLDMKRYLETIGYQADGIRGALDTLVEWRVPAIVLINDRGYRHFVIVKGVQQDRVLIGDPSSGMRTVSRTDFESMWNGILFVIRDHAGLASQSFNQQQDWHLTAQAPTAATVVQEGVASRTLLIPPPSDF
jgi:predicted double-glycine peptidase